MLETVKEYLHNNWLLAISTPIYSVLILLEVVVSNYKRNRYYSFKETVMNFWLNIANTALGLGIKVGILFILGWFFSFHLVTWQPSILYWVVLFFGVDICFYFEHRCEHYSRILWAVHVTHHSSQEFNLTTGFRSSVFRPFVSFWFFIPLVIIGFHPLDILLMDAICQIYGIIVHTRYIKKMPHWFEAIFVSPSHHRVHHASNVRYLDKNMGMVLIIWDRFFGTYQPELEEEAVVYGLTKNPEHPHHPIRIITHEWESLFKDLTRKEISFKEFVLYLVNPPGWSHYGKTKTAKQLRKESRN